MDAGQGQDNGRKIEGEMNEKSGLKALPGKRKWLL
jgi:hypothetical protein